MACRIKVHSATMSKALGLATLRVGKRQNQRIPALEVVRLVAGADGLFIISPILKVSSQFGLMRRRRASWRCHRGRSWL
ncbi:hypothetical protein DAA51_14255 [Bradyrhizobium sp. WBAH10]|nr:hypothetical protein [Bradyrhizobium sp. WBAH30]MDD1544263.1 hypothetical protein [Bradyrhizobium sp. WBAH41]MDD1558145.1 hypothetical protein [Bradyrhizobium sp. WBAH23]MDD1565543.1 hypothetical protein [Bradyrhizobium sp. WBAH33]MDD1590673.1 hypothetical protein [Bradyrhizobium sp. WBAH42]NRB89221.1 hypothetical protein [Bradyrhizobium sp. WBAH10]QCJ89600.1 hypothetical protein DAA57_14665 [Bradyrhizobium yuanmingense]